MPDTPAVRRRSVPRATADLVFGAWFVLVFTTCAFVCLLAVLVLPGLARRQRVVTAMARLVFVLTGTGPVMDGLDHLPDGPCVVVANHQSYLDGIVMTAVLPPRFSFVIKAEMQNVPLAGLVLRRIDSFFVDRSHAQASASAARQILRAARGGRALGFFPEGTFTAHEGIHPFRRGAFAAAKAGKLPIVPVVIRGTRQVLRSERWWPRAGRIHVRILAPIEADAVEHHSAAQLAALARERVLTYAEEPDLEAAAGSAA